MQRSPAADLTIGEPTKPDGVHSRNPTHILRRTLVVLSEIATRRHCLIEVSGTDRYTSGDNFARF